MLPLCCVATKRHTAAKRIEVCSEFVGLSFLAIVIVSNLSRLQRCWLRVVLVLCCAAVPVRVIWAQSGGYVFTTICPNPPGVPGVGCEAYGINNNGQIVGKESGVPGFLYEGGSLSSVPLAGQGINNTGEIVGDGFLDVAGSLSSVAFPSATQTSAVGINDAGEIVGYYRDSSGNYHGLLDVGGNFSSIDFPGAVATYAFGINASEQIVGYYFDILANGSPHGFLYSAGNFSSINFPSAFGTAPHGINNDGQISGMWEDIGGGGPQHGFVDTGGTFSSIDFPSAP